MGETAAATMALTRVKVREKRSVPASVYVYEDRIEVVTRTGTRAVPLATITWVGVKASFRSAILVIMAGPDERLMISGLRRADAGRAHRAVVELAAQLHPTGPGGAR